MKQENSLRVEFCNIRSICNKFNLISAHCRSQSSPDILFLTETWLKPIHTDSLFCPVGYEVLRCDRKNTRGGGVLALYKSHLRVCQVELKTNTTDISHDIVCIDIFNVKSTVRFCCVYDPPAQNSLTVSSLCKLLNQILLSSPLFIIQSSATKSRTR